MAPAKIGDASTAHDGHSLAGESPALRGSRSGKGPGRIRDEMLRRLHRLLLGVVVVLACVGVTGPFRGLASVRASIAVAARDPANARRGGWSSGASPRCGDVAARPTVDLRAIESDLDGEDDALGDVADEQALAVASAPSREPGRPPALEVPIDTSRFAIASSLARGPPV